MRDGATTLLAHRLRCLTALILILLACGRIAWPATAAAERDWNRTDDPMKSAIGLHAGKIGGVGVSLKVPVWWWLYLQPTGLIWHTEDRKRHNIGVQLLYLLRQDAHLRVYGVAGAAYFYDKQRKSQDGHEYEEVDDFWNWGIGVGVEWLLSSRWSLQGDIDFTYNGSNGDIYPFPQAGIYFYW